MIRLHRHPLSGHSHRVELLLSLLELEHEQVEVDLLAGEQRSAAFRALNRFGQVPVLEDGDQAFADSNAILVYLATRYAPDWLPRDPESSARVQRWLSLAAGPIASGPAAARLAIVFGAEVDHEAAVARSEELLAHVEAELESRDWLATGRPTIADVAAYTYIAHAPEGGVDLDPFPAVRAWLRRVEALPHFVGMRRTPLAA